MLLEAPKEGFYVKGTMGTDHSFSEKALMLSCIQKTEQPVKGFCHKGCRECYGAEREGTSFALSVFYFPMFSFMPVKIKS